MPVFGSAQPFNMIKFISRLCELLLSPRRKNGILYAKYAALYFVKGEAEIKRFFSFMIFFIHEPGGVSDA